MLRSAAAFARSLSCRSSYQRHRLSGPSSVVCQRPATVLTSARSSSMAGEAETKPKRPAKRKHSAAKQAATPDSDAAADENKAAAAANAAPAPDERADASPKKKGGKRAKGSQLPTEPVGDRYEESMRPPRLTDNCRTIMSWNVAGAL